MNNKEKYRAFCKTEDKIPVFSKDWWLDSVCGEEGWEVLLIEKGGDIVASMPYQIKKKRGFLFIEMPILTQTLGPYIKYPMGQSYYKKLSFEKGIMCEFEERLPKADFFSQMFHYKITNWLPFFWRGYSQTTRYTYIIENISYKSLDSLFSSSRKRRVKKAKKIGVTIFDNKYNDIDKFYQLVEMTFQRQGMKTPYSKDIVEKIYKNGLEKDSVKIFYAEYQNEIIACNLIVYDKNTVYYLIGGIDPNYKDLGAMDLIQYESIKYALEEGKSFDFEGSMIESVEHYFRSFGAKQKPYFHVYKTNSKLLTTLSFLKKIIR